MSDIMRPLPFGELLHRIFSEFEQSQSIFGISRDQFFRPEADHGFNVWGERCVSAVGPAAGPHTQLAQNIICAFLVGGRFMELKTVQKLDQLEISKPCIDAEDEAYNCEWSTEYTLPKAYDEYLKAWMALHLLEALICPVETAGGRGFVFNMSVGYDLEGIKTPPMQKYIADMLDASPVAEFSAYQAHMIEFAEERELSELFDGALAKSALKEHLAAISPILTRGVTLSTLHGCPPAEIEAICRYMIDERGINTFVKLNPTLLGYDRVRGILDKAGFTHVNLSKESFEHDLQMDDAKAMLLRLKMLGESKSIGFGVKLTNTLGTLNTKGRLPDKEMYMSGRALFPLSINLALELSKYFNGELPISYSGGASKLNIKEIFETGIRPITMATELLKPGGYLRLKDCALELENSEKWEATAVDLQKLECLAGKAIEADYSQAAWRESQPISVHKAVPLTDCAIAPCKVACPISQDVPEYLHLMGQQRYSEALDVIYSRNALPSMTGHICEHNCQLNCTRRDYEGAVNIREMKKLALKFGWDEYLAKWTQPKQSARKAKIAVVGAGPAGLSAAYFLAKSGHRVTIFEKEASAGGVVQNIIPKFRIPREVIEHDIQFVQSHGVEIQFAADPKRQYQDYQALGYRYVVFAIGCDKGNALQLSGSPKTQFKALDFLKQFNSDTLANIGKHVVVVGGGNTAMDSARAAIRIPGVERVSVLYRRSLNEMPAHREEFQLAIKDGVAFEFLANPEGYDDSGDLVVRKMALGQPDTTGRRSVTATAETFAVKADCLITAIGESLDLKKLSELGVCPEGTLALSDAGQIGESQAFLIGDANTGPDSVVSAIASASKAADSILKLEQTAVENKQIITAVKAEDIQAKKGRLQPQLIASTTHDFVAQESARCLQCSTVCNKCVEVCPNRANVAIEVAGFSNRYQVLHLDAYCNECGNCAQFCPWESKPYKDKFTVFSLEEDFYNSSNLGFYTSKQKLLLRTDQGVSEHNLGHETFNAEQASAQERALINQILKQHSYLLGEVAL